MKRFHDEISRLTEYIKPILIPSKDQEIDVTKITEAAFILSFLNKIVSVIENIIKQTAVLPQTCWGATADCFILWGKSNDENTLPIPAAFFRDVSEGVAILESTSYRYPQHDHYPISKNIASFKQLDVVLAHRDPFLMLFCPKHFYPIQMSNINKTYSRLKNQFVKNVLELLQKTNFHDYSKSVLRKVLKRNNKIYADNVISKRAMFSELYAEHEIPIDNKDTPFYDFSKDDDDDDKDDDRTLASERARKILEITNVLQKFHAFILKKEALRLKEAADEKEPAKDPETTENKTSKDHEKKAIFIKEEPVVDCKTTHDETKAIFIKEEPVEGFKTTPQTTRSSNRNASKGTRSNKK
jgi:hypothetical protein